MTKVPSEFQGPNVSPDMQATLVDFFDNNNGRYAAVPLVLSEIREAGLSGEVEINNALLLGFNPSTGDIRLDSVSKKGEQNKELASVAYDLIGLLQPKPMAIELGALLETARHANLRCLGGVMLMGSAAHNREFATLIVPTVYKFGVYDQIDMNDAENTHLITKSREEVSTVLTANLLSWVIELGFEVDK